MLLTPNYAPWGKGSSCHAAQGMETVAVAGAAFLHFAPANRCDGAAPGIARAGREFWLKFALMRP
jgi:hypothetical protein